MSKTTIETSNHPFERAGMGRAPFHYVGMEHQDLCYGQAILNRGEYQRTGVALTTKPGGTCACCGTYIVHMYRVRSSDGRESHVGCECIEKCKRPGDKLDGAKRARNAARSVQAKARKAERKAARKAELASTAEQRLGSVLARLDAAEAASHCSMWSDWAAELRGGVWEDLAAWKLDRLAKYESGDWYR